MSVKLLTVHNLEFLSFKGGCTGSSECSCPNATLLEMTCHGSYVPVHETLVLITHAQKPPIKAHADVSRGVRGLMFSQS